MRSQLVLLAILLFHFLPVKAEKVIKDINFDRGSWAMVGVPLHNYKLLPIQKELSTFITHDTGFMKEIQQAWDFERTFEDKCDYHYALKFYLNDNLVKTLNLNLHCGYVTSEGISFVFNPEEFGRFREHASQISWSRISFADLDLLKKAINKLEQAENVYWYEDVKQYTFPGFIVVSLNGLPWNTDRDSLFNVVEKQIVNKARTTRFYLQRYFHIIRDDKLYIKYIVNCDNAVAGRLEQYADYPWRSHLHNRDSISILAIGVDRQRYWKLMNQ